MLRRVITGLATLLILAVGAVAIAPFVLPSDWIRDRVVAAVEEASGLRLQLSGPVSLSLFPMPALDARDVAIARGDAPTLATIGRVRFGLAPWPLVDGRVEVTGLSLDAPTVTLSVDADGRANWAAADQGGAGGADAGAGGSVAVSVSSIEITDGTVSYTDARSGSSEQVTGLSLSTALEDLAAPLTASGRLTLRAITTDFSARLDTPARFLGERRGDLAVTLAVGDASLTVQGLVDLGAATLFTGAVSAVAPDLRATAAAVSLPPLPSVAFKAEAKLAASTTRFEATALSLAADDLQVSGDVGVDLAGVRPRVDAHLAVPALDIDRLKAFLPPPGGRGKGGTIDPALLSLVDGGVDVRIGRITGAAFAKAGAVEGLHLVAVADAGTVTTVLDGITLAGGSLGAKTTLRPDEARIRLDGSVTADGFDIGALAALAGTAVPVSGRIGADLTFAAAGRSVAAFSETLDASGSVNLSGGAVSGLGLAAALGDPAADRLDRIALEARFASLEDPLRIDGSARLGARPLTFSATVDPRRILDGQAFQFAGQVASGGVRAAFDGDVMPAEASVTGRASLTAESLSALAAFVGRPAGGLPEGAFRVAADLETSARSVSVDNLKVALGDGGFTGSVTVALRDRPKISARLEGPVVDIGGLIAGAAGAGGSGSPAAPADGGWSDEPLALAGLGAFDADVRISADALRYGALTTGRAAASLVVQDGKLTLDLAKAALFGGNAAGTVTLDAARGTPSAAVRFSLDGTDIAPVLAATVGTGRVTGKATATADLATEGRSVRAMVAGLSGEVSLAIRDGALKGVDLPALLRSVATAIATGFGAEGKAFTPFSVLSARFRVAEGIASTDDLTLTSPAVTVLGGGRIDLPAKAVALRVNPKLAVPNGADALSFEVPVVIEGPWAAPRIYPDIQGILQDPAAAYAKLQSLNGLFGQLAGAPKKQSIGAVLDGIVPGLGALAKGKGQPPATSEDVADQLLGAVTGGEGVGSLMPPGADALDVLIGRVGDDPPPADDAVPPAEDIAPPGETAAGDPGTGDVPIPRPRPGRRGDAARDLAETPALLDGPGGAAPPIEDPALLDGAPAAPPPVAEPPPDKPKKPRKEKPAPAADAGAPPADGEAAPPADKKPGKPRKEKPAPQETPADAAPAVDAAPAADAGPAEGEPAAAPKPKKPKTEAPAAAAPDALCGDGSAPPCADAADPLKALIDGAASQ